jgi:hypothetical protein
MNTSNATITVLAELALLDAAATPAAATVERGTDATVDSSGTSAGSPSDLPGPVPGFVEELPGSIRAFVGGLAPGEPGTDRSAVAGGR